MTKVKLCQQQNNFQKLDCSIFTKVKLLISVAVKVTDHLKFRKKNPKGI